MLHWRPLLAAFLGWIALSASPSFGQIVRDNSLGNMKNLPLAGPNYAITHDLGEIQGGNLFHSFSEFNLHTIGSTVETATFTGPETIGNILARISGSNASTINGLIKSEILGAQLYFFNPNGVVFGPNARLDVRGGFYVSTADFLRFTNGTQYFAKLTENSTLSTAPIAAFGFLSFAPAPITLSPGAVLALPPGQVFSVLGGDIQIVGTQMSAPAGLVQLASVASQGEILLGPPGLVQDPLNVSSFSALGRLDLLSSVIDVSGTPMAPVGGAVLIRGGQVVIENSLLQSLTVALDGGPISIAGASAQIAGSQIQTASLGPAKSGDILITVGALTLTNGAIISSLTVPNPMLPGQPQGGMIAVTAQDSISITGQRAGTFNFLPSVPGLPDFTNIPSGIYSESFSAGTGSNILVQAPLLTLQGGQITSHAFGTGTAGDLTFLVQRMELLEGGLLASFTFGEGSAGQIQVAAAESITMSGHSEASLGIGTFTLQGFPSAMLSFSFGPGKAGQVSAATLSLTMNEGAISSSGFVGGAGGVDVQAGNIVLTGGAAIDSSTFASGDGGNVSVTASEQVSISGRSNRSIIAGPLTIPSHESGIGAATYGSGKAGTVAVTTPMLIMFDDGLISTATGGDGIAGSIAVNAGRISLSGGAVISSSGGLNVGEIFLVGNGPGGDIHLMATESMTVAGHSALNPARPSGVLTTALGGGPGGTITIETARLQMEDGAVINADTRGPGPAGDISLNVTRAVLEGGSVISATTFGQGDGGGITVHAGESLTLTGETPGPVSFGAISFSHFPSSLFTAAFADGAGGQVTVSATSVSMQKGAIAAQTFGAGNAGAIVVQTGTLVLTEGALITAATNNAGKGGSIMIMANEAITIDGNRSDVFIGGSGPPLLNSPSGFFTNAFGTGEGGTVTVSAPTLTMGALAGGGEIGAQTFGPAKAGSILVEVGTLILANGAIISGTTLGPGEGGSVTVSASESITIAGRHPGTFGAGAVIFENNQSSIVSLTLAEGKAGRVTVSTPTLSLHNEGTISTATGGAGAAGEVTVSTGILTLTSGGLITSSSGIQIGDAFFAGIGAAGTVTIQTIGPVIIAGPGSGILTTTVGPGSGGSINLFSAVLEMHAGIISADTKGTGAAGQIFVEVGSVTLDLGSRISSLTEGSMPDAGAAGDITVLAAGSIEVLGETPFPVTIGGVTFSHLPSAVASATFGTGPGGRVSISAQSLTLVKGIIDVESFGSGNAGQVLVDVGKLELHDGAFIGATTTGAGMGGQLEVRASESIVIDGFRTDSFPAGGGIELINANSSIVSNSYGLGKGGKVSVATPILKMGETTGGGSIGANAFGVGDAGEIAIEVGQLIMRNGASILGTTLVGGTGGSITVTAEDSISIAGQHPGSFGVTGVTFDHIQSDISSITIGTGKAGRITVSTAQLDLHDGGIISAATGGQGAAGDVTVNSGTLSLASGGQISSSSGIKIGEQFFLGEGAGGSVTANASGLLSMSGQGSGFFTSSSGNGAGGNINIGALQVQMSNAATVSARSEGTGNAGNILMTAGDSIVLTDSIIQTEAQQADGGNITLIAPNMIRLTNSTISSSVGGGVTTIGGNIIIDPQFVILQNSQIIAKAIAGQGGNIQITAGVFLADSQSIIDASSRFGLSGSVTINSPIQNLSGTLAPLNQAYLAAAGLLRERCAVRAQASQLSTFLVRGRDGLPPAPGNLLPSTPAPLPPISRTPQSRGATSDHALNRPADVPPEGMSQAAIGACSP